MAAREFHGYLENRTDQDISLKDLECDSGEWTIAASTGAQKITPGGEGRFSTESDGFMTGTSGRAHWSIDAGTHYEHIVINWSIPYVDLGSPNITCAILYSDPRESWKTNGTTAFEIGYETSSSGQDFMADLPYVAGAFMVLPVTWFLGLNIPLTSPSVRFVVRRRQTGSTSSPLEGEITVPDENDVLTSAFRVRADYAARYGFAGGIPTFYFAPGGNGAQLGGTVFVKPAAAIWRDISSEDLSGTLPSDFASSMRATQDYAVRNGFVGGFPTFHENPETKLRGVVLVSSDVAEWRDVPLLALGSDLRLDDVEGRFRATQDYAVQEGFVGGFPTMYNTAPGPLSMMNNPGCGTILLNREMAEFRDVVTIPPVN